MLDHIRPSDVLQLARETYDSRGMRMTFEEEHAIRTRAQELLECLEPYGTQDKQEACTFINILDGNSFHDLEFISLVFEMQKVIGVEESSYAELLKRLRQTWMRRVVHAVLFALIKHPDEHARKSGQLVNEWPHILSHFPSD